MEELFLFCLGILAGLIIAWIIKPRPIGDIRVDYSDLDGPYLFLELNTPLDVLYEKKEIVLSVKIEDFIPRK